MMAITFFLLLFLSVFKGEFEVFGTGPQLHPLVELLFRYGWMAAPVVGVTAIITLLRGRGFSLRGLGSTHFFLLAALLSAVRGWFYDPSLGLKLLSGFLILVTIYFYVEACVFRYGLARVIGAMQASFLMSALGILAINLLSYFGGYGYGLYSPRFYGASQHPNFLGVQVAISAVVISAAMISRGRISRIALAAALAAAVFLLVKTGSRTGIVAMGAGIFVVGWIWSSGSVVKRLLLVSATLILGAYAVISIFGGGVEEFDRGLGSSNTRTIVWKIMLAEFLESPLWGAGHLALASEGSFLRALALYGVLYAIPMIMAYAFLLVGLYRSRSVVGVYCAPVIVALLAGGVFEGYLVDAYSLPVIAIFLISSVVGPMPRMTGRGQLSSMRS